MKMSIRSCCCLLILAFGLLSTNSAFSLAPSALRSTHLGSTTSSSSSATTTRLFVGDVGKISSTSKVSNVASPTTSKTTSASSMDHAALITQQAIADGLPDDSSSKEEESLEFQKGFAIIAFITLLNASLAPVWHFVFEGGHGPPPLFLNAVVSVTAFLGLVAGAPLLDSSVDSMSRLADNNNEQTKWGAKSWRGGMELGFWKGLGTTCHIYGMALTTANHGAFLLQLTTLIVPVLQGLRGAERIPRQIQVAVALALAGIYAFTQDPTGASQVPGNPALAQLGDGLVLGAAFFYSLYDIQTFYWGREVPRTELVTIKVGFQAVLSCALCAVAARPEVVEYMQSGPDYAVLIPTVLWSGLIVNALATFLQVGGMQAVGPTRAQTIFASQPLWAAGLNYAFLGSILGIQGFVGGAAFLGALFLAATAEAPTPVLNSNEE